MSIVTLRRPEVKERETSRPKKCPSCGGETFQCWGGAVREVRDPRIQKVVVYRYRCCTCGHTFRHYPPGISQAIQTVRVRDIRRGRTKSGPYPLQCRKSCQFPGPE